MQDVILDYLSAPGDEQFWSRLRMQFDNLSSLFDMRLETEKEAVGHETVGRDGKRNWASDAPHWDGHRAWLLLPYVDALDQTHLQEQIDIGRSLALSIGQRLKNRELSASFLYDWGRFCLAAGLIQFVYFSNTSIGHKRSAMAGGKAKMDDVESHQRWFAHHFLRHYERGGREDAERVVERLVNAIVDGKIDMPTDYSVEWFESFLKLEDPDAPDYARLRPAFSEHSLSVRRMKELKARGADGIPPIDLENPDP